MSVHNRHRPIRRRGRFVVSAALAIVSATAGAQTTRAPMSRSERLATDTLTLSFDAAVLRALRDGEEVRSANASVDVADAQV